MKDVECVEFLQWALPQMDMRWRGFRKVRRQVGKRIARRSRELGLQDPASYHRYLESHPEEWEWLDRFCRISISRFYRDRGVFDLIRDEVLPGLAAAVRQRGTNLVRCWSAGCASGEEAYTLSLIWELCVRQEYPEVRLAVTATDVDPHLLQRAREARYPFSSLKELPPDWLQSAFVREANDFELQSRFRQHVDWVCQDIRHDMPEGPFDLILCRHLVFTYFDESLQKKLLGQLVDRIHRGGFLVTGKQETLPMLPPELGLWRPHSGLYRKDSP